MARSLTDTVTGSTVAIVVARDAAANVSAMYLGYDVTFYKTTMVTFINKVPVMVLDVCYDILIYHVFIFIGYL